MAKAALNMLTHTSASDLAKDGIFMNAVDTGWVTDEDRIQLAKLKKRIFMIFNHRLISWTELHVFAILSLMGFSRVNTGVENS